MGAPGDLPVNHTFESKAAYMVLPRIFGGRMLRAVGHCCERDLFLNFPIQTISVTFTDSEIF
jgi:hypothetical protein